MNLTKGGFQPGQIIGDLSKTNFNFHMNNFDRLLEKQTWL